MQEILLLPEKFQPRKYGRTFGLINIDPGEFQRQRSDLAVMMECYHFIVKADELLPEKWTL